jgi:branched-chain amino acid transport system permease protein
VNELARTIVAGLASGGRIALVVVGLSLVLRTSGVINLAQGAWMLLGAYLVAALVDSGLSFWLAAALAAAVGAGLSAATFRVVVRPMRGQPAHAVVLVTLGVLGVVTQLTAAVWGTDARNLGDPFGVATVSVAGVTVARRELFAIVAALAVLGAVAVVLRTTAVGLATRAVAADREAAATQGIDPDRVVMGCWAAAGAAAVVAGVAASTGASRLGPGLVGASFVALAAVVVGGLDSPLGGVVAAFGIGVVEELVAVYQPRHLAALGDDLAGVVPYVVMAIVLVARPTGIAGSVEPWRP